MRIVDWLLCRDAGLAKRIAEGIGLNRVSSVRDVNGWDEIAAYARETDGVYEEGGIWLHVTPGG